MGELQKILDETRKKKAALARFLTEGGEKPFEAKTSYGHIVAHRDPREAGKPWRLTFFSTGEKQPDGHATFSSFRELVSELSAYGVHSPEGIKRSGPWSRNPPGDRAREAARRAVAAQDQDAGERALERYEEVTGVRIDMDPELLARAVRTHLQRMPPHRIADALGQAIQTAHNRGRNVEILLQRPDDLFQLMVGGASRTEATAARAKVAEEAKARDAKEAIEELKRERALKTLTSKRATTDKAAAKARAKGLEIDEPEYVSELAKGLREAAAERAKGIETGDAPKFACEASSTARQRDWDQREIAGRAGVIEHGDDPGAAKREAQKLARSAAIVAGVDLIGDLSATGMVEAANRYQRRAEPYRGKEREKYLEAARRLEQAARDMGNAATTTLSERDHLAMSAAQFARGIELNNPSRAEKPYPLPAERLIMTNPETKADKFSDAFGVPYEAHLVPLWPKKRKLEGHRIASAKDIVAYMRGAMQSPQERVYILLMNQRNEIMGVVMATQGTINASVVSPREIFAAAVAARAVSIVVVHNHPSGDATPSEADLHMTTVLMKAGETLDIPVLDHIVLGADGKYTSLQAAGLMPRPQNRVGETQFARANPLDTREIVSLRSQQNPLMPIEEAEAIPGHDRAGRDAMPHSKKTIAALEESLSREGWDEKRPIKVTVRRGGGKFRDEGNHRLVAAKRIGMTKVPVEFFSSDGRLFRNPLDPACMQIGKAYLAAPDVSKTERARKLYAQYSAETEVLFNLIRLKVDFTTADPYKSAADMLEQVSKTGVMRIYSGGNDHPLLSETANLKGRAVHDLLAHLVCGCPFTATGEFNAFEAQAALYSVEVRPLLFTEIVGQTCAYIAQGQKHAEQKVLFLPERLEEAAQGMRKRFKGLGLAGVIERGWIDPKVLEIAERTGYSLRYLYAVLENKPVVASNPSDTSTGWTKGAVRSQAPLWSRWL